MSAPTTHQVSAVQNGYESGSARVPHTSTGTLFNKLGETLGKGADTSAAGNVAGSLVGELYTYLFDPSSVDIWEGYHSLFLRNLSAHREAHVQLADHVGDSDDRESTVSHHQGLQYLEHGNLANDKGLELQLRGYTNTADDENRGRFRLQRTRGLRLFGQDTCSPSCIEVGVCLDNYANANSVDNTTGVVTFTDQAGRFLVGDRIRLDGNTATVTAVDLTSGTITIFPPSAASNTGTVQLCSCKDENLELVTDVDAGVGITTNAGAFGDVGATQVEVSDVSNLDIGMIIEFQTTGVSTTITNISGNIITFSPPVDGLVTNDGEQVFQYSAEQGSSRIKIVDTTNLRVGNIIRLVDDGILPNNPTELHTIVAINGSLVDLQTPLANRFDQPTDDQTSIYVCPAERVYLDEDVDGQQIFVNPQTVFSASQGATTIEPMDASGFNIGCVVEIFDDNGSELAIIVGDDGAGVLTLDRPLSTDYTASPGMRLASLKRGNSLFFEGGRWNCEAVPFGQFVGVDEACVAKYIEAALNAYFGVGIFNVTFDDVAEEGNSNREVPKFPVYRITNTDSNSYLFTGGNLFTQIGANNSLRGTSPDDSDYGVFTKPIYVEADSSVVVSASTPLHGFKLLNWSAGTADSVNDPRVQPDFATECWKFRVVSMYSCEVTASSQKDTLKVQQTLVRDSQTPQELRPLTAQTRVNVESEHTGVDQDHQVLNAWNQRVFDTTVFGATGIPNPDFKIWSYNSGVNQEMNTTTNNGAKPVNGGTFWAVQYVGEDSKPHRVIAHASAYETQQHQIFLQEAPGTVDVSDPQQAIRHNVSGGAVAGGPARFYNVRNGTLEIAQMGGESSRSRLDCIVRLRTGYWYRIYHQVENTSLQGQGIEKNVARMPLGSPDDTVYAELRIQDAVHA